MFLWTCSKSLKLASHYTLYFPSHIAFFYALSVIFIYCFSLVFQLSIFVYCTASCLLSSFSWRSYPLFNELHSAIFLLLLLFLITSISMEKTIILWNICVTCLATNINNKWFTFSVSMVTCSSKWHFSGWKETMFIFQKHWYFGKKDWLYIRKPPEKLFP